MISLIPSVISHSSTSLQHDYFNDPLENQPPSSTFAHSYSMDLIASSLSENVNHLQFS